MQTQPAIRPPQYPFEILWNLEDCQHDVDVNLHDSNRSRPSMDRAVRHPDGTMITDVEWSAIRASARRIANELAGLQDSTRQAKMRRTKMFYRTHHARDWTNAITRLESEQPLLKLCSSNWKAEHTLGNSIQALLSKQSYVSKRNRTRGKGTGTGKGKGRKLGSDDDGSDDSGYGRGGDGGATCKLFYYHESPKSFYT